MTATTAKKSVSSTTAAVVASPAPKRKPAAKAAPAPVAKGACILHGLKGELSAYNGLECTEVHALPRPNHHVSQQILVSVPYAPLGKPELIAVPESNLTSPERAAKTRAADEALNKERDACVAYLLSLGFKPDTKYKNTTWATPGKRVFTTVTIEQVESGNDAFEVCIETCLNMQSINADYLGDEFEVETAKEFKKYMLDTFKNLADDMADKEFLVVVAMAHAVVAQAKAEKPVRKSRKAAK